MSCYKRPNKSCLCRTRKQPWWSKDMKVLDMGTLKSLTKEKSGQIFPKEVPATLKLYLDGKIEQFWLRDEMKGAVFLMNVQSVAEAKELLGALPLTRENLHTFELMPIGPLLPLGFLIN